MPGPPVVSFWKLLNPLQRQYEFLKASLKYRYMLFGGARGPGKSRTLRWGMLWRLIFWWQELRISDVRVALFCEDYPVLRDRQVSKIAIEFPSYLGRLKETKTDGLGFYLHESYGGGVILLRNLDDPQKYVGAEFAGIGVDELTRNPKTTFDDLRGSLRWPGITDTFFWGATNPLGIGTTWVRALWVEKDFTEFPELESLSHEFHYVRALPQDNPYLTSEYWADLRSQPPHIQKAWIDADWYALPGAAFEEWRTPYHVTSADFRAPRDAVFYGGMDWGYRKPGAFVVFVVMPELVLAYEEFYFKQIDGYQAGEAIGNLLRGYPPLEYVACDPQMWQNTGSSGLTVGEEVQVGLAKAFGVMDTQEGVNFMPKLIQETKGKGYRLAKKTVMHRYLAYQEYPHPETGTPYCPPWAQPMLKFRPQCKNCIRTIPALPYKKDTEDVDTDAEDHCYDAVAAFLMSRPPLIDRPPRPKRDTRDRHPGYQAGSDPAMYIRRKPKFLGQNRPEESDDRFTREREPVD